jgi:hypothetical protein
MSRHNALQQIGGELRAVARWPCACQGSLWPTSGKDRTRKSLDTASALTRCDSMNERAPAVLEASDIASFVLAFLAKRSV